MTSITSNSSFATSNPSCVKLENSKQCNSWNGYYVNTTAEEIFFNLPLNSLKNTRNIDNFILDESDPFSVDDYVHSLLISAGCTNLTNVNSNIRYLKTVLCSNLIGNAARNPGSTDCNPSPLPQPPLICEFVCSTFVTSVENILTNERKCPNTTIASIGNVVHSITRLCGGLVLSDKNCVRGVSDEVSTCGFGNQNEALVLNWCSLVPNDKCCLASKFEIPPTNPTKQNNEIPNHILKKERKKKETEKNFYTDYIGIVEYEPQFPTEVEVRVGDYVVLEEILNNGWSVGLNQTSGAKGFICMACLRPLNLESKVVEVEESPLPSIVS
ncbi:hypothetical protein HK099_004673 [Clydaea vesicula]|uniref:SH3 domain-containing protein n=1 Tax=Clydaea vesicula TaxID=447962 RepID=A0AAD5TZZ5_9FUNG|nr:hypothetical protein HK099_004673 [Clydaea vesicula]KAJ3390311.1 hypothetical protein HDU92_000550 [Lobulomyces angularis]